MYLELLPVNPEGLTTADEKQVLRNAALLAKGNWSDSGKSWSASGKGAYQNYTWIPAGKAGKGAGKKGDQKGKGKGKGKGKKTGGTDDDHQ